MNSVSDKTQKITLGATRCLPSKRYQYHSFGITDKGKHREHNEDAFLDLNAHTVWVVADGAGGHSSGEIASNMIITHLSKHLSALTKNLALYEMAAEVKASLSHVNSELIQLSGGESTHDLIASTVCVLIIRNRKCLCLWAGDSRIYLYRRNKLTTLTHDHNRIAELMAAGFSEQEAEKYPISQQLTHAIGVEEPLYLEQQLYEIKSDDIFLLCSDGLYKELTEEEIETKLTTIEMEQEALRLMNEALDKQARDNVTVLLVHAE